jgi:hypothetical protein
MKRLQFGSFLNSFTRSNHRRGKDKPLRRAELVCFLSDPLKSGMQPLLLILHLADSVGLSALLGCKNFYANRI